MKKTNMLSENTKKFNELNRLLADMTQKRGNKLIALIVNEGWMTKAQLAKELNLSRERVGQIVERETNV